MKLSSILNSENPKGALPPASVPSSKGHAPTTVPSNGLHARGKNCSSGTTDTGGPGTNTQKEKSSFLPTGNGSTSMPNLRPFPSADDSLIHHLRQVRTSLKDTNSPQSALKFSTTEEPRLQKGNPKPDPVGSQSSTRTPMHGTNSSIRGERENPPQQVAFLGPTRLQEGQSSRPFVCPQCAARFFKKDHATKHWRAVHLKQRPHSCPHCESRFSQRSDLNKHVNAVHLRLQPFKCEQCSQSFSHRGNLVRHSAVVHDGRRPYSCDLCGSTFAERCNLRKHLQSMHGTKK